MGQSHSSVPQAMSATSSSQGMRLRAYPTMDGVLSNVDKQVSAAGPNCPEQTPTPLPENTLQPQVWLRVLEPYFLSLFVLLPPITPALSVSATWVASGSISSSLWASISSPVKWGPLPVVIGSGENMQSSGSGARQVRSWGTLGRHRILCTHL